MSEHTRNTTSPVSPREGTGEVSPFYRWVHLISRFGGYGAAFFMLCIVLLILVEITVRTGWDSSTQIASEYSGYFMVALVLLGFAETFRSEAFIRIELLQPRLSPLGRRICELLAGVLSLGITLYALRYSIDMTRESWLLDMRADTMSETPFWIPQLAVPVGLALLALEILLYILRRVRPL